LYKPIVVAPQKRAKQNLQRGLLYQSQKSELQRRHRVDESEAHGFLLFLSILVVILSARLHTYYFQIKNAMDLQVRPIFLQCNIVCPLLTLNSKLSAKSQQCMESFAHPEATTFEGFHGLKVPCTRAGINTKQRLPPSFFQLRLLGVPEITSICKGIASLWGCNVKALAGCEDLICIQKPFCTK
jgi:hypothetical protein